MHSKKYKLSETSEVRNTRIDEAEVKRNLIEKAAGILVRAVPKEHMPRLLKLLDVCVADIYRE